MTTSNSPGDDSPVAGATDIPEFELDVGENNDIYWIRWQSGLHPGMTHLIGWLMNTRPISQGNKSDGESMWAYSERIH